MKKIVSASSGLAGLLYALAGACANPLPHALAPPRAIAASFATRPHGTRAHRMTAGSPAGCTADYTGGASTTNGFDYFVAIGDSGQSNYAAGLAGSVLGGQSNESCGDDASIASGSQNGIDPNAPYSFIGGGAMNGETGQYDAIGGGGSNAVTANYGSLGGGEQNTVSNEFGTIGGGYLNSNAAGYGTIAGGEGNSLMPGGSYSTIAGGSGNVISNDYSFIGAGTNNAITAFSSAIVAGGGGGPNSISGFDSIIGAGDSNTVVANEAFVGAGTSNSISQAGTYSAIAGGGHNTASGEYAAILGGYGNVASGPYAVVAGGDTDAAAGTLSFAAGYHADAAHSGSFVWSDYSSGSAAVKDTAVNQFVVRASGGVYVYSNEGTTAGVKLAAGSGTWSSLSDRNAKTGIVALDDDSILAKVSALPVSAWRYKSESGVLHLGPMAQDFYAAFGVGEDDRHITSIDEDGVALAAIKAVDRKLERVQFDGRRKDAELARQRGEIAALRTEMRQMKSAIASLRTR